MDYLVTFEDGSEAHLSHHGVKGMKWGVWNAETKAKYSHLSSQGIKRSLLEKYSKASDRAWKASNAASSKGLLYPIRKAKESRAQKKLVKAQDKLVDAYMNRSSSYDIDKEDRNFAFDRELHNLKGAKKSQGKSPELAKLYKVNMMEIENNYQLSEAKKRGREALESYVKYGTPGDSSGRSKREYAARQGVAVKSEAEGKKYASLQENMLNKMDALNRFVMENPKETYNGGSDAYRKLLSEDKKAQKSFDDYRNKRLALK